MFLKDLATIVGISHLVVISSTKMRFLLIEDGAWMLLACQADLLGGEDSFAKVQQAVEPTTTSCCRMFATEFAEIFPAE